jgi:hypothetical protein
MKGFNETKEIRMKLLSSKMSYACIEKAICDAYVLGSQNARGYER